MPSLRAWEQDSEVRAHLQARQCPIGKEVGDDPQVGVVQVLVAQAQRCVIAVSDGELVERECLQVCQGATGTRRGECSEAGVADLVVVKRELPALRQRPTGPSVSESTCVSVADLVIVEMQDLELRHQCDGSQRRRPMAPELPRKV